MLRHFYDMAAFHAGKIASTTNTKGGKKTSNWDEFKRMPLSWAGARRRRRRSRARTMVEREKAEAGCGLQSKAPTPTPPASPFLTTPAPAGATALEEWDAIQAAGAPLSALQDVCH